MTTTRSAAARSAATRSAATSFAGAVRRAIERLPVRHRIGTLVAVAVIAAGLLLRPLLSSSHGTRDIAPASPAPAPSFAGAPSSTFDRQAQTVAQTAAVHALACAPNAPARSCGNLHVSTVAVLPATASPSSSSAAVVEIVGQLTTTTTPADVDVPIAVRVIVVRTPSGWSSTVSHA